MKNTSSSIIKFLLPVALGCSVFALASDARADMASDVNAAYQDSLSALSEVAAFISAGEDDFSVLDAAAVDLHDRAYDAVQLQEAVYACGVNCRTLQGTIDSAVANLEDALEDLDLHGYGYDYFLDWCCASESGGNYYGCQGAGSIWTVCEGICWSCNEGWTNLDGSFGCNGGYEQDCPAG